MENILEELKDEPFNGESIDKILEGKTKIIAYEDLAKFKNIDDLFGTFSSVCILFPIAETFGHWTCIIKHGKYDEHKTWIEFFDSYGFYPDKQWDYINPLYQKPHYLSRLLANSKYPVDYNNIKLQADDVVTCARHVVYRISMKNLPLERYQRMLMNFKKLSPDEIVCMMTNFMK